MWRLRRAASANTAPTTCSACWPARPSAWASAHKATRFAFGAATNRADLLLQLQLFCAFLTDPGYRPESIRQVHKAAEQLYLQLAHTPDGPLQLEVAGLLANHDPRFGLPPKDVLLTTLAR